MSSEKMPPADRQATKASPLGRTSLYFPQFRLLAKVGGDLFSFIFPYAAGLHVSSDLEAEYGMGGKRKDKILDKFIISLRAGFSGQFFTLVESANACLGRCDPARQPAGMSSEAETKTRADRGSGSG